jgi:hypothetical protein
MNRRVRLTARLGRCAGPELCIRDLTLKATYEIVEVTKNPEIADEWAIKGKHWHAVPPDMPARWCYSKKLPSGVAVESKLGENLVSLFRNGHDIRGVPIQSSGDMFNIANEWRVTRELRAKRSPKREIRMENLGHECGIGVVPHFLVEEANYLLLV